MKWVYLPQTDSTNRVAKELARQGAEHGTVVLAETQTDGRGRLGRDFFSPPGGLYVSLILYPRLAPEKRVLMTPLAAVAVCRALRQSCGVAPTIKWVNDLYLSDKKLCGILCEGAGEAVIVGIGLNVQTPPGGFPPELNAAALDVPVEREMLARAIAGQLLELCEQLPDTGFLAEYRANNLVLDKDITVQPVAGAPYPARTVEIDGLGRLVVQKDGRLTALDSGQVSIRI